MLVALLNGERIEASRSLERGLAYLCPGFDHPLILKAGPRRIAHFSHLPGTSCSWAKGETLEHLAAKKTFRDAFLARGLRAECECIVDCLPGDRRADVMVWSPRKDIPVAVELQHTAISEWEMEARVRSYARAGIAQIWIPILRHAHCAPGSWDDRVIERYPPRPFERWLHEHMPSPICYYDPTTAALWRGTFSPCLLWRDESNWYEEGGEERSEGGFAYESARWVRLHLYGGFDLAELRLKLGIHRGMACASFLEELLVHDPHEC